MFTKEELEKFIREVFKIIENNPNESPSKKIELVKKEVERRVKR